MSRAVLKDEMIKAIIFALAVYAAIVCLGYFTGTLAYLGSEPAHLKEARDADN